MVNINKEIEMIAVLQKANAEQSVVIYVKWYHHSLLFLFDISDMLYLQAESLTVVDALHRFTLFVQFYSCKQRRMCSYDGLYSSLKISFIQTSIQRI